MAHPATMSFSEPAAQIVDLDPREIPEVRLMEPLRPIEELIIKTCRYLLIKGAFQKNAPFKGFLLHGPVGTGKTEIVRQVVRKLALQLEDKATIRFIPVDSSVIASPKWGESERAFNRIFGYVDQIRGKYNNPKVILLFDDIESLMLSRGMSAAKEWHYSLNSVFFHKVDSQNPSEIITFATTNRLDLLDSAIKTRLYSIYVPTVPIEELVKASAELLDGMMTEEAKEKRGLVLEEVRRRLEDMENPTIRDARQLLIITCVEKGIWSA